MYYFKIFLICLRVAANFKECKHIKGTHSYDIITLDR